MSNSVMDAIEASASKLYNDLIKIQDWTYKLEISFNHDRTKQAQEVICSSKDIRKSKKGYHPSFCWLINT